MCIRDRSSTVGDDTDGDGIIDAADVDFSAGADVNSNGIDDSFEADPDGDGHASIFGNDGLLVLSDEDGDNIPDVLDTPANNGLVTGVSGAGVGCVLHSDAQVVDPLFPTVLSILSLLFYRRKKTCLS